FPCYRFTPVGVLSLIAFTTASVRDLVQNFQALGILVGLMVVGVLLHQLILMPTLFFVLTRRNPYRFAVQIGKAWMIVFATTSPAMAIPEILSACEDHQKGHSNGSVMLIAAASIFIGNVVGMDLNAGDIILIGILADICSMALPSIPSASIVAIVMILTSMNIPAGSISLLFAVEWFLDRIRSTSNLVSHTHCVVVTYHFCKKSLEQSDMLQDIEIGDDKAQQSAF
ncbi:excitatory amino acid transporter 2-like, partial [Mizuhopecten yessoensis]|uniref:excitatory amino acid transporter 2-like n=1 Tax=Mizuhopecten yessoensis TaxID=6573 RepID=UPI000B45CB18